MGEPVSDPAAREGHPVAVLVQNEETRKFELQEEELKKILFDPRIADKHVCVLAVAGAFRKGKSFLLNFLLRFLNSQNLILNDGSISQTSSSYQQIGDWLADEDKPLTGFSWRGGWKRETTGVLIWSEPFLVKRSDEEIAVLLMDTQGTFDTKASMKDSTVVFALTLIVSSVVVYNLTSQIQEDDLMNLQLFTSYGMMAQEQLEMGHPFQTLYFLVRDWAYPYDLPYGYQGGQSMLEDILNVTEKQDPTSKKVRKDLRKCFKEMKCYLMPHPGTKILEKADFDGRIKDISIEFLKNLKILVKYLLNPENLVKKELNGQLIKASNLFKFFTIFMEVMHDNDLPEPTTFVEYIMKTTSMVALEMGKSLYNDQMRALVVYESPFLKAEEITQKHEQIKALAIQTYLNNNKYGQINQNMLNDHQAELEDDIQKLYATYCEQNAAKERLGVAHKLSTMIKDPTTLVTVASLSIGALKWAKYIPK